MHTQGKKDEPKKQIKIRLPLRCEQISHDSMSQISSAFCSNNPTNSLRLQT
jgi:hypothetical protein